MIKFIDIIRVIVAFILVIPCLSILADDNIICNLFGFLWTGFLYGLSFTMFGKKICLSYYKLYYKFFGSLKED